MPLILHPSSCCDVCLEPFTESNPRPPHAIPCGHIFCRECLFSMNPSTCPFCRRPYLPDRIKKLITSDRGAHDDMSEDLLLHRILANWYVQAELAISKTEAENWLNSRPNNANLPIKRILEILDHYETLKSQAEKYQMRARQMKHQLRRHEQVAIYEKDTAQAVEHSLQGKLEELGAKSARYEAEIQRLRTEIESFRNRTNPLPRPPEPVEVQPVPPLPAGAFTFSPSDFPYRLTDMPDIDDDRTHGPYFYISEDEDGHEVYHVLSRPPSPSKIPKSREERDRLLYDIHRYPPPKRSYIPGAIPGERVIPKKDALEPRPFDGFWPNPNGDTGLELHFDNPPNTTLPAAWTNGTGYRPGQPPKPFPAPPPLLGAILPPAPPSHSHSSRSHSHRSGGESQAAQLAELLSDPTTQFRSATSHQRHKRGNPWPVIEDAALPPGFQPTMHSVGAILSPNTSSALTQSVASLMENMSVDQSSNQSRPPPSSAPASTSTSSYRSSQSFVSDDSSMHRPRPRRRSTARTNGSNPVPPDDASQTSSRHRRESAAPDAAHANGYMHVAHMRTDAVETGSVLVERQSIDSWGTVDSRNPPLRRRPSTLNSVQDMPLVTFAADASRRAMIHSDTSSLLSPSLANPFANSSAGAGLQAPHQSQPQTDRQTMDGESADRHPDNSTPRSGSLTTLVPGASAAIVYSEHPSGSSSRANDRERHRERHEHERERQHRRSSSGWPNAYNASSSSLSRPGSSHHSIASSGESGASGAQAPQSHRSHGRHSRSVSLATITPVTMNGNGTPDARYTNPSRSSNDSRYWSNSTNGTRAVADNSTARRAIPVNALGLEIRHTPPVDERPPLSAPTPVVAAQSFLRSFSNGSEL